MGLAVVLAGLCFLWAVSAAGGEEGAVAAITALVVGLPMLVGGELYARSYVKRIDWDPYNQELHLHTLSYFGGGHHRLRQHDIVRSRTEEGGWGTGASAWLMISVRGRSLPLLVDKLGTFHDGEMLARLLR